MRRCGLVAFAAVVLGVLAGGVSAQPEPEKFGEGLRRVPVGANALVLIDTAAIRQTAFAKQEARALGAIARELNPHILAPAEIERLVLASNLDTADQRPLWEVAMLSANVNLSAEEIAKYAQGQVERLADRAAVHLPKGVYCAKLDAKLYGVYAPDDRQMVSRWIRAGEAATTSTLSPYLAEMARFTDKGTQVIMALDLTDSVSAAALHETLKTSETLKDRAVNLERLADLIASIGGATLGIKFSQEARASLRIDFARDAEMLKDLAKPLILEALHKRQLMIEDMLTWTAEVKGRTVFFNGPLSVKGLRRVMMLIDPPNVPLSDPSKSRPEDAVPASTSADPKVAASQKHFKSIRTLLDDVRNPHDGIITVGQQAKWYEKYAKRIDNLPMLNVDADLIEYGARTASRLRGVSVEYRGVGISAGQQSANPTINYDPVYAGGVYNPYTGAGYYGGVYAASRGPSPRNVEMKLGRGEAARSQFDVLKAIDDDTAAMRKLMTQRYQAEF